MDAFLVLLLGNLRPALAWVLGKDVLERVLRAVLVEDRAGRLSLEREQDVPNDVGVARRRRAQRLLGERRTKRLVGHVYRAHRPDHIARLPHFDAGDALREAVVEALLIL